MAVFVVEVLGADLGRRRNILKTVEPRLLGARRDRNGADVGDELVDAFHILLPHDCVQIMPNIDDVARAANGGELAKIAVEAGVRLSQHPGEAIVPQGLWDDIDDRSPERLIGMLLKYELSPGDFRAIVVCATRESPTVQVGVIKQALTMWLGRSLAGDAQWGVLDPDSLELQMVAFRAPH